jgi:PAS domain S-box-containing protein
MHCYQIWEKMSDSNELTHLMELNLLILESVGDGVFGLDKNGMTTFCNPAAKDLTGWTPSDLMEQHSHAT